MVCLRVLSVDAFANEVNCLAGLQLASSSLAVADSLMSSLTPVNAK